MGPSYDPITCVGTNAVKCEAPSAQAVPARGTKRRKIVRNLSTRCTLTVAEEVY